MTIEIHQPELEQLMQQEIQSGHFRTVDDLLTQAIHALREKSRNSGTEVKPRRTRAEVGAHIRAARIGNRLPEGLTIRDLINEGRA